MSISLQPPDDDLLRRYLLGQTTDVEVDAIERYLERHPEFAERLPRDLVSDPLLRALRAPPCTLVLSESQNRELMGRLEKLAAGELTVAIGSRVGYFGDYELLAE
ncbi:MAG: hypothetical protein ACREHD_32270, partial [Pirellulales bacterium]